MDDGFVEHTLTENLFIKSNVDNSPLRGDAEPWAHANMYQMDKTGLYAPADANGRCQFSIYPLPVTHRVLAEGYKLRTPIFDAYLGHDCQVASRDFETKLDLLPVGETAFIRFVNKDYSTGYYPDATMQLEYNVGVVNAMYRSGSYIRIFRPYTDEESIRIPASGGLEPYYYSPPTKNYTPGTAGTRGLWAVSLRDSGGIELDNDSALFGTQGELGYDTSNVCSGSKLRITWEKHRAQSIR